MICDMLFSPACNDHWLYVMCLGVKEGQVVEGGQQIAVIEAMKMQVCLLLVIAYFMCICFILVPYYVIYHVQVLCWLTTYFAFYRMCCEPRRE
ncbi:hypothetical protein EON63_06930 [archaeon]|nr:MAG: hypothetical protein EON63_06930 [archaeon]